MAIEEKEEDSNSETETCGEVLEDMEEKSIDSVSSEGKRAADAIAGDKAVCRKSSRLSNKEAAMQSAETLASALRDMGSKQEERRKNDVMVWIEHEAKERAKDRGLQRLQLELKERESQRNYELEMMRLRCYGGGTAQPLFTRPGQQFTQGSSSTSVDQECFDYNRGQISSDSSSTSTYYNFP